MLGHENGNVTLNTYAELWPSRTDEVTDAMEAVRMRALEQRGDAQIRALRPRRRD